MRTLADAVEMGIVARSAEGNKQTVPPTKKLRDVLARLIHGKTAVQIQAALDAVQGATGNNSLAASTLRGAMRDSLDVALPATLPAVATVGETLRLKNDLAAAGLPTALLNGAFTNAAGVVHDVQDVDVRAIAAYVGMIISVAQVGKLANAIRDRKILVYGPTGNNGVGSHAVGGTGGHRRARESKLVAKRLKQRRSELWKWAREHNSLIEQLKVATSQWAALRDANDRLPAPPVEHSDLPEPMSNEQIRDPAHVPPNTGATRAECVDVAFVDATRAFRSHMEEAQTAGPAYALAFVESLAKTHTDIASRVINGLVPLLAPRDIGAEVDGTALEVALECSPRLRAIARHYPLSMLPPQVAIQPSGWGSTFNVIVLQAWRQLLPRQMRLVYAQLADALRTLECVLPTGAGLRPCDYGVYPLQLGQPAPPPLAGHPLQLGQPAPPQLAGHAAGDLDQPATPVTADSSPGNSSNGDSLSDDSSDSEPAALEGLCSNAVIDVK